MESMRRILCLVLLTTFLSSSFLMQPVHAYDNSKYGFSITPPTGWSIQKENEGVIAVMFLDLSSGASINVVVEETRATLSVYVASSKSVLASTFGNYTLVSEGGRVIGGLDCYSLISTWTEQGFEIKAEQVIFVENGKAFVISCGAPKSQYVNHIGDFENSLASFRITSQASILQWVELVVAAVVVIVLVIALAAILFLRKKKPAPPPPPLQPLASPQAAPATQITETKFCRYCGTENKLDAVYCEKCAKKIG